MKIVLKLTGPDGVSELVTIEAGANFTVPEGMTAEIVSLEGVDDLRVEGGELVLAGGAGTIRIAGLGADFLAQTASIAENGIDGPLPDGFLRLFGWFDTEDGGPSDTDPVLAGQGSGTKQNDDDLPPPLDSSNDGESVTAPSAPVISTWSDDTGRSGDGITSDTTLTLSGTAEAGATVTLFDGATELGTTVAGSDGIWTFDTAALADGAHEFTATAANAGGTGETSAPVTVTVDTAAPGAPVISGYSADTGTQDDGITADTTLTLTGTAEADATIEIFDGAASLGTVTADGSGAWSFTTVALGDGQHDFTATATDAAGNVSGASDVTAVTVDTAAPAIPVIESFGDDTGTQGDRITSDDTLTLTGTAEADATVEIFDGATSLGTVTADGSGNWTFTSAALADGEHEFTVTATDAAGNATDSAAYAVTVDTAAPDAPAITGYSDDTGAAGDRLTADNTLTLTGTAEADAIIEIFDGATSLGTGTADDSGNWTFASAELADGEHDFTATATDAAGNTSAASSALAVTVDAEVPDAPAITGFSDDTGLPDDNLTNDTTVTLDGTAEAGATVEIFDGLTSLGTVTADGAGAWSFTTASLPEGAHEFTAVATNAAGTASPASSALTVSIDTTGPGLTVTSPISGDGLVNAAEDGSVSLSGTSSGGQLVYVTFRDGADATVSGIAAVDGAGNWTMAGADISGLQNGEISVEVHAVDPAGNSSSVVTRTVVLDNAAPATPSVSSSISDDTGSSGSDRNTSDDTIALSGTAEAGVTVEIRNGATVIGSAVADGAGAWSFTTAALGEGTHALSARAVDAAGNTSAYSASVTVVVDQTEPGLTVAAPVAGDGVVNAAEDGAVSLSGTASDAQRVVVTFRDANDAEVTASAAVNGAGNWVLSGTDISGLLNGPVEVEAYAEDQAGNRSPVDTQTITLDNAAPPKPVILSFADDTGNADGQTSDNTLTFSGTAEAGATVNVYRGGIVVATGVADGDGNWSAVSGVLSDGYASYVARATDAAGNTSLPSDSLIVIIDTEAPAVPVLSGYSDDTGIAGDDVTRDNTLTLSGTGQNGTTIVIYDNDVQIGTAIVSGGAWSFTTSALPDGEHSFTVTARDYVGNESAASAAQIVTVDRTAPLAPAITGFSDDSGTQGDARTSDTTLTLSGTAEAGATVELFDGGASLGTALADGDGNWSFNTAVLGEGAHSFTARATDAQGNTGMSSSAFAVTVDTTPPSAPSITGFSDDSGSQGDRITNDTTLVISGTAIAGSVVEVFDGATSLGTVTANGAGAWSLTTGVLADGAHGFTATATDAAGNTSAASSSYGVTVDTAPSPAPVVTGISSDTGTAGDGITSDTTLTISGTAVAFAVVEVFNGAVSLGTTAANAAGVWSIAAGTLTEGDYEFTATATGAAGNVSAPSGAYAVTVDTTAPVKPIIAGWSDDTGNADGQTADNTLTFSGTAEAGATVNVYRAGIVVASGTADGDGNWSATSGVLADGYASYSARAVDAAGNAGVPSDPVIIIIDTTPPGVPAISGYSTDTGSDGGDDITRDNTLTLTGTAQATSTRVVVYDNGVEIGTALVSGGAWTFTTPALANGDHSLTVAARDYVGNESAATAPLDVTIDSLAPTAPAITGFSDDTGTQGDGITADTTLVLSGTAEAGSTVTLYDGATPLGTVVADGDGNWSFATGTLATGPHSFTATATDVAGNTSGASASLGVSVFVAVSTAPVISGFTEDTGQTGDGLTSDTTVTFTGTAQADAVVEIFSGLVSLGTVTADGGGNWSFTTSELAEGSHVFDATATAPDSSTSPRSAEISVTIDTTAPGIEITTPVATDNLVNALEDGSLTVTGTASGGQFVTVTFRDSLGGTVVETAAVNGVGAWTLTGVDVSGLENGSIDIEAVATDQAGNQSGTATVSVIYDSAAPAAPVISGFSDDTGTQANLTSDTTLTFTGTAEANATVQLFRGGGLVGTATADGDGNWTITTGELSEGYTSYEARALDAAGNASGWSNSLSIGIDTTAPAMPAIASFSNDSGVQGDGLTNDTTLTLTGTGAPGSTIVVYDGGVELGTTFVAGGGAWSFTTAALVDGEHSFTATARDGAGNESAATAVFDVTIDATRPDVPVITGYSDDTGNPDFQTSDNTLTFTGTAGAGETVNVYLGATLVATGVADGGGIWSASAGVIADGFHYFYARAVDAAGNQSVQSSNYVVSIDTVPPAAPVITGLSNDNGAEPDDGISSFNWTYVSGTAAAGSTNVAVYRDGVQVGTAQVSGGSWTLLVSALPEGTHSFTAVARDYVGNESGESNEVEFTVDLTAPAIPVLVSMSDDTGTPGDFRTSDTTPTFSGTSEAGATITVRDGSTVLGTATADGSGNWSYTADTLSEGVHAITIRATDAAGRSSSYSDTQLVVVDTTAPDAPVIAGFSDDSLPTGDGITGDTTPTLSGTAAANSTVEILSGGNVIGTVTSAGNGTWSFTTEELAEGSYSFTARVSDNVGNVSDESAALGITIASGPPPVTATPTITLYSNDTGASGDGITRDNALDLYGTTVNGATVEIFDGGVSLGTVTADGAGNWHFLTGTLADGDHDFTVVATAPGGYGESDPSAVFSVTVDTTAPAVPVIAGFSDDTGYSSSDNQTFDNTLTFTGTADANVTINIFRGGGLIATTTADGNGDWSVTTGTLADGYASYEARAVDAAGNMSLPSSSMTIGIDTVAPAAPVITGFSPDSGTQGDGITTNNFIAVTGTAQSGTRYVVIYDNGVEVGEATVSGTSWVFYTESLTEGAHEFTAVSFDYAGNEGDESGGLTVTIDDTAPPVPVITAISEDTGFSATDKQTSDTTPTITGTAQAGATVRILINGGSVGTTVADGNGDWSFTTGTLADGYHNVTVRAEDASGNQSDQTGAMYVLVDTTPPAVTVTTPIAGDNLVNASEDGYFNVSGTSVGGHTVYVTFTDELGGTVTGTATVNGTSWTLNGANISGLENGEITIEAYAVDRAGNQSGTVTNTIELDNVGPAAPVIAGFTDDTGIANNQTSDTTPTLTGTAGAGETIRVYLGGSQIGTATADGSGNWTVTTSVLPEGYHSITARAVDDAGNLSAFSNTQIVWVDTTAPAAPSITAWGSDTGTVGDGITDDNTITLWGTRPTASFVNVYDNGVLLGTVPMTGTTWNFTTAALPDGEHSFTVTAVDGAANESVASTALDITVQTVPPVPASNDTISSVPDGWTVFEDNGHAYSLVGAENYWANAQSRAAAALPGESYLLTITSAEENTFVTTIDSGRLWLGATDVATEGTWMWQTGPEAGTAFWFGDSSGSAVAGAYSNWASGQPSVVDGFGADEDYLIRNSSAQWNDSLSSDTYFAASAMAEIGGNGHSYADDVNEDAVYTFAGSILLQNDGEGASISSVSATSTMGASLTYDAGTGEIVYDPTAAASIQALADGQTETDSFTYTLAGGNSATVSIEVAGRDEVFMMSMSSTFDASSLFDMSDEIPGLPGDDAGGAGGGGEESDYFAYFDSGTSQLYAQDPASETGTLSAVA
ncbi:MAG: Ig-like domain-containing protein [Parvibaculum sp.]|uniref:Ig-like domain-containing protein n=1 Tax=Parvibaculum sp. TaxID=2024848 RepID=UPI003263F916